MSPGSTYFWVLSLVLFLSTSLFLIHYDFNQSKTNDLTKVNLVQNFFNFQSAPKKSYAKKLKKIPKYMLDLYRNSGPEIVKSILPKEFESARKFFDSFEAENHLLVFDLPQKNPREELDHAELRIFTQIQATSERRGVERVVHVGHLNDSTKSIEIYGKLHCYHYNNTWLSFNISALIENLLAINSKTLTLILGVENLSDDNDEFELVLEPRSVDHEHPLLLLSYRSTKERSKRNVDPEDYEEETNQVWSADGINSKPSFLKRIRRLQNTCKRKPLYVDFAEINFDSWIVQPEGYEAYQCSGKCFYPVAEHLTPTKHAIIQALMHSSAPQRYARVCCVPTRLGAISVLYVDSKGTLTYRYDYQDMVVLECGCR